MNIVIHRYNSICEPDYIEAFKNIGIDVIEDKAEMTDKNIPIQKRVEILTELILVNNPMFVFSINFYPFISMICERLGVKYVCVSVDCPVMELFSEMIKNKCNRIFLFDYKQYLEVHDANPECIFHLPLGVNVSRLDATIGEPDWNYLLSEKGNVENYKYDISFIGSLYTEKNKYPKMYEKLSDFYKGMCDGLINAQAIFNGQNIIEQSLSEELIEEIKRTDKTFYPSDLSFKNIDSFVALNDYFGTELTVRDRNEIIVGLSQALQEIGDFHLFTRSDVSGLKSSGAPISFHGGVKSLDEMPNVFRKSRINLNPTMRPIQMGLPQRIWDVLGAGGFLLTNFQAELPEYFEIGTHLEAYESLDEACDKCAYYLTHEDERLEIAHNGYELVKAKHTVLNRVIEMIRIISE